MHKKQIPPTANIYIIDDDDAVRHSLSVMLELEGYSVWASDHVPDIPVSGTTSLPLCIILDLQLRDDQCIKCIEAVSGIPNGPQLVVMTGSRGGRARERVRQAGAHLILDKPFSAVALTGFIDEIADQINEHPAST